MTLIELLLVVFILVALAAAIIPAIRPAFASRKTREAARQINGYFVGAKARAAAVGRPVGIWIERVVPGSGASMNLFIAEQPAPYAGDLDPARAAVVDIQPRPQLPAPNGRRMTIWFVNSTSMYSDDENLRLVNPGDQIIFGYGGLRYDIVRVGAVNQVISFVELYLAPNVPIPPITPQIPYIDVNQPPSILVSFNGINYNVPRGIEFFGAPFQIFRQPRKTNSRPLALPNGVVLDLTNSGFHLISPRIPNFSSLWNFSPQNSRGPDNRWGVAGQDDDGNGVTDDPSESGWAGSDDIKDDDPVVIMFNPNGTIERVYWRHPYVDPIAAMQNNNPQVLPVFKGEHVTGSLYFLIGKADKMVNAGALPWSSIDNRQYTFNENLLDSANLWVSVRVNTGNVITAENIWERNGVNGPAYQFFLDQFNACRQFARSGIGMGGR